MRWKVESDKRLFGGKVEALTEGKTHGELNGGMQETLDGK